MCKDNVLTNSVEANGYPQAKNWTCKNHTSNSKWIIHLNIKCKNYKTFSGKYRRKSLWPKVSQTVLRYDIKSTIHEIQEKSE